MAGENTATKAHRASVTAPVNIAVIKYWGKRDTKLNLPTNSSLSVTLSQDDLRTHTTAACSPEFGSEDTLLLNGEPQELNTRTRNCLSILRDARAKYEATENTLPNLSQHALRIVTYNNFPTAAGLASSAAGFAALVYAIATLYQLQSTPTELSIYARQGSGSACRSLFGGYVAWEAGTSPDGLDSCAVQVAPRDHWPEMRAVILVASAAKKGVSSTAGMQQTVASSTLFPSRADETVPRRMRAMEAAITARDFAAFAELTMRDSNSFHAVCADTYPPIYYMNDVSRAAVRLVEGINERAGEAVAAYTFDAGPNCVVYYLERHSGAVAGAIKLLLQASADGFDKQGWAGIEADADTKAWVEEAREGREALFESVRRGISRVILTSVGEGPQVVQEHLIDEAGQAVDGASIVFSRP